MGVLALLATALVVSVAIGIGFFAAWIVRRRRGKADFMLGLELDNLPPMNEATNHEETDSFSEYVPSRVGSAVEPIYSEVGEWPRFDDVASAVYSDVYDVFSRTAPSYRVSAQFPQVVIVER